MGRADSPLRDRMVFLVGAQRSGTNWLQRMLATHPDIATLPSETQLFTAGIDVLAERVQHGVLSSTSTATVFMDRDDFLDAARDFCDAAYGGVAERLHAGSPRILERSPNHVERLSLIGEVYPDAWVVHIVRDGRDVARSLVSQRWGPTQVHDAAHLWARSVRAARAAAPALRRYREVRYEDLLADPAGGLASLLAFLDLDASSATVEAALHEAGVAYNVDANRPEIGDGKWRDEWSAGDLAVFDEVAGDVLRELGYPSASVTSRPVGTGRVRRSLAGRLRRPVSEPGPSRPYLPLEQQQRRVDALCAALAAGDADIAAAHFAPAALVRVVGAGGDRQARAEAGRELLAKSLAAEPRPWGRQRRGDVHVAGSGFTVVLSHDGPGGQADRVVVVAFDAESLVTAVTLYGFPL